MSYAYHREQSYDASPVRSPIPKKEDLSFACECRGARQYERKLLKRAAELERQAELAAQELVTVRLENKKELDFILKRQEMERSSLKNELERCDLLRTDFMSFSLGVMNGSIPRQQGSRD